MNDSGELANPTGSKRFLLDYSREELTAVLKDLGLPAYRSGQIRRWIFARKTDSFDQMTDLSKDHRRLLSEFFCPNVNPPVPPDSQSQSLEKSLLVRDNHIVNIRQEEISDSADSSVKTDSSATLESEIRPGSIWSSKLIATTGSPDGTMKILLEFPDGHRVESVLLGFEHRHKTACISTQVGCAMHCAFCASGLDGFVRNLTRGEILEQLLRLNALLGPNDRLTHVVVMGTGEPTLNLTNLLSALSDATAQDGLDIGNRRITVSSVGIPAGIRKMADADVPYKLAVSLHAPNDEIRDQIIPQNRVTGIKDVLCAADYYFRATGRRVTFEYILIDELNSKPEHARELAHLLAGKTAIVNLIPYNPVRELSFKTPPAHAVQRFAEILESMGIQVKTRFRMGDKIDAACGQLRRSFRDR